MILRDFRRAVTLPVSVDALFAWHERPGAFARLAPPWDAPRVLSQDSGLHDGARVALSVRAGPLRTTWRMVHRDYQPGRQFVDVMESGPFAHWTHTHRFASDGPSRSTLDDHIAYALPLGWLGDAVGHRYAESTLARVFAYRHALLQGDIARHAAFADRPRLRIAITGASGFIGAPLAAFLSTGGHTVLRIGRGPVRPGVTDIAWDPMRGVLDASALEGVDAVIHLAGASIGERWTPAHRAAIRESRVQGTALLARTLASLSRRPSVMVSGSAIGFYGAHTDGVCDEASPVGADFLGEVSQAWEAATAPAESAGIRVVHARTGIVMGAAGGVLARQLPLFQLGLGGPIGRGGRWISPIALDDIIGALHWCCMRDDVRGPVNLVAPTPVTNAEFTRTLARVLRRPAFATVPPVVLRTVFGGEMADATILASQRVVPTRLQASGFAFRFPTLEAMLRFELGQ